jgi:hypothetical protein
MIDDERWTKRFDFARMHEGRRRNVRDITNRMSQPMRSLRRNYFAAKGFDSLIRGASRDDG